MPRGIAKRLIALLLAVLTIATSIYIPDIAYADDEDDKKKQNNTGGVGGGDIKGGGSSKGSFSESFTGYRMYFINKDGERVSNIVDIVMTNPKAKIGDNGDYVLNTRFESLSGDGGDNYRRKLATSGEEGLHFSDGKVMGSPIIYVTDANGKNGHYEAQGEEFREWMMAGEEMLVGAGGTGGVIGDYTVTNPIPDIEITPEIQAMFDRVYYDASGFLYALRIHEGEKYTRDAAIAMALQQAVDEMYALLKELGPEYRKAVTHTIREIRNNLEEYTPRSGWKDSTGDEIDEDDDPTIHTSLIDRIIDIAYADTLGNMSDEVQDATQKNNGKGHITELLNNNGLFVFIPGTVDEKFYKDAKGNDITDAVETMIANELYLIVEPIFWFVPAKTKKPDPNDEDNDGKTDDAVIGDASSKWFYGTPVNYGQWHESLTNWSDGGQGGWYNRALNMTGAQSLFIPAPLVGNNGNIVNKFDNTKLGVRNNHYLATMYKDDGYAMHYYYGIQGQLPEIPTYDIVSTGGQENKDPHPAQDPDATEIDSSDPKISELDGLGTIDLASGELKGIGSSTYDIELNGLTEEEIVKGYRNHSRTITIVKTYTKEVPCKEDDPECDGVNEDGVPYKYEHVGTYVTYDTPGTISIQHEPDYKVDEWFTTEDSAYDWLEIMPDYVTLNDPLYVRDDIESVSWGKTEECETGITSIIPKQFWSRTEKYDWSKATEEELKAGIEVIKLKMGLAADPDYDSEDPEAGEPEVGYYENTLYVHLVSRPKELKTHTLDRELSPGPAPDPNAEHEGGPLTEEEKEQCVFNIVKVYETSVDGETTVSVISTRLDTAGIIEIENESHLPAKYQVLDWYWTKDDPPVTSAESWEELTGKTGSALGSGYGAIDEVDIRNPDDRFEPRTLYVHLFREINVVGAPI